LQAVNGMTCKKSRREEEKKKEEEEEEEQIVATRIFYYFVFLLLGFLLFKEYCTILCDEPVPQLKFYEEVGEERLFFCLFVNCLEFFKDKTI
jgi:hypothetical protein